MNPARKRILGWFFVAVTIFVCMTPQFQSVAKLPGEIRLSEGTLHSLPINFPLSLWVLVDSPDSLRINGAELGELAQKVGRSTGLSLEPMREGRVELKISILGITIKRVNLEIVPTIALAPGGNSVGISLKSDGVMVVGLANIQTAAGLRSPGREAGLQMGDRILSINGVEKPGIDMIGQLVHQSGLANQMVAMTVARGSSVVPITLQPRLCSDSGLFRLGIYVRDDATGIGTLTFVDRQSQTYGALGHAIADMDTGQVIEAGSGRVVRATVTSISAGRKGAPGEKRSVFVDEHKTVGNIVKNTPFGIFGEVMDDITLGQSEQPIRLRDEIREGPAQILTVIDGQTVEAFDVEIVRVARQQFTPAAKGLIIQVTDPLLLERTGGIVQGMSGSPILQDGQLVGAVTHVFVNDPSRGYGVLIEWMIQESGLLEKRQEVSPTFFYRSVFRAS